MTLILALLAPALAASFAEPVPGTILIDLYGNIVTTGTFPRGAPATVRLVTDRLLGLPPTDRYMSVPLDDPAYSVSSAAILNSPGLAGGTVLEPHGAYRKVLVLSDAAYVSWRNADTKALSWRVCTHSTTLTAAWVSAYPDQAGRRIWECAPEPGEFFIGSGEKHAPVELHSTGHATPTRFTIGDSAIGNSGRPEATLHTVVDGAEQERATVVFMDRRAGADVIVRPRGAQVSFQVEWEDRRGIRTTNVTPSVPLSTPIDLPPVGFTYGFLVHDLGRSISGTLQVYPIFAPKKLEYWPLAYHANFLTVSAGIRFGSNEDLLGLTLGPALNLAPGFQLLGGLQFGTANITDPWRVEREWFVGVGFSPDVFTRVRKFQKDRAEQAAPSTATGGAS